MSNIAIIVPEYNEPNLEGRLDVFDELGRRLEGTANIVVVDDASTNGNKELLASYIALHNPAFSAHYMDSNGQKVGAIKSAVKSLPEDVDTVFLTDIDSTYLNLTAEKAIGIRQDLYSSSNVVGGSFRLKPAKSNGFLERMQTTEYEFMRSVTRFLQKEEKSFCVQGPSGVFKRSVLEKLLDEHSGRHNGDDKELTALAMKRGGKLKYWDNVDVETITPHTIKGLFKQRVRYAVGALETYAKEHSFYFKESLTAFKGKRFGLITALELYGAAALPLGVYALAKTISDGNLEALGNYWAVDTAFTSAWLLYGRKEIENKIATALTLPVMPFYRLGVMLPARIVGNVKFYSGMIKDAHNAHVNPLGGVAGRVKSAVGSFSNAVSATAKKAAVTATSSLYTLVR